MGLSTAQIEIDLAEIFHHVFDEEIALHRGLTADHVDGWDSLTHVRLLLTIERKFRIRFSAPETARLRTVGDLLDLIESKCASSPQNQ
jgi:acyl carrier protein